MAGSIVDSIMQMLGTQVAGPIASHLGMSADTVQSGLQTSAGAMLAGIAAKADQPGFMGQISSLLSNPAVAGGSLSSVLSNPASLLTGGAGAGGLGELGSKFLSTIFGGNLSSVTDAIGKTAGLPAGKASSMMAMAAPLVLGGLGKYVRDSNLSTGDLVSKLKAEAPSLQSILPAGFRSLLGGTAAAAAVAPVVVAKATNKWLWPAIIIAALLLGLLWFFSRSKTPETLQNATNAVAGLGDFLKTKLPDGVELNIPQFGIENKLIAFLNSSQPVDTTTWFNFDRLLFDTGQATLQPSSQEQLSNIAAILKAYPNVHVKIGGYTDNTGDAQANLALSEARAKNVMDALVSAGIDPSRLESKGYGDQYPVGDNSTDAGRAQNRRIALLVTQK
jgi:OmpA-OmpF porin, OOP family